MKEQNFSNHTRYIPTYHFGLYSIVGVALIASVVNFIRAIKGGSDLYEAGILLTLCACIIPFSLYARSFSLKAQDRAIRAEENLRHYVLTGKLLDKQLRMGQIVALRFAPDEEFVELAKKAVAEKLSNKEIKQLIKNWRPDYHRA